MPSVYTVAVMRGIGGALCMLIVMAVLWAADVNAAAAAVTAFSGIAGHEPSQHVEWLLRGSALLVPPFIGFMLTACMSVAVGQHRLFFAKYK